MKYADLQPLELLMTANPKQINFLCGQ